MNRLHPPLNCILSITALAYLSGCNFSPKPQPPTMDVAAKFKETGPWKVAAPADYLPKGSWWNVFHDSGLNELMGRVSVDNQSLQSAAGKAEQAAALLKSAKLAFLPTSNATGSVTRSNNGSGGNAGVSGSPSNLQNIRSAGVSMGWELDLWGKLRHSANAAAADAEAALADVESMRLSLQAQAAQTYFNLQAANAQKALLQSEVESYEKSLGMTKNRAAQGVASNADVAQAETQLATTKASLIESDVQRATLSHALATLAGQSAQAYEIKPTALAASVPSLPEALASTLMQRRPDIAAAERHVAAANERIGAAKAAFFPALNLTAQTGWRGIADIFTQAANTWSLGASLAEPILDSGQRIVAKAQADSAYKSTVADYRQTVLTALQEAEDAIATLRILAEETIAQAQAVQAARENERIAKSQYEAGTVSYLNVATAQAAALNAERTAIDLRLRRLNASVGLIKAMGGHW